jgi:hypothetical protein
LILFVVYRLTRLFYGRTKLYVCTSSIITDAFAKYLAGAFSAEKQPRRQHSRTRAVGD